MLKMENSIYSKNYSGLTVRNGRLINEQPNVGMAGVTAAALQRKAMRQEKKISMMEEAYVRAESKMDAMEMLMKKYK
jgi:hypothetical protein